MKKLILLGIIVGGVLYFKDIQNFMNHFNINSAIHSAMSAAKLKVPF